MEAPREPPHLDLVHVARRLHKARGLECRLTSLERGLLGFVRHDDVPSSDVSACYLHFLRTGDTKALLGVIEHNAWDVVAMAALVGLYGHLPIGPDAAAADPDMAECAPLVADDLAGVARTLRRAGRVDEAFEVADRAARAGGGTVALSARAEIAKARGDLARALLDFEALDARLDATDGGEPAPRARLKVRLELAKLYEHYVKEHSRALAMVDAGTGEAPAASLRRAHRIRAKMEKKQQSELFGPAPARGRRGA
jgi:hypothetical protein